MEKKKEEEEEEEEEKKEAARVRRQRPAAASRVFGGGSTLCPGRRLATTEILIFVSIFLLRYDAEPVDGPWSWPKPQYVNMTNSVMPPPKELRVKIAKREGFREKITWVSV